MCRVQLLKVFKARKAVSPIISTLIMLSIVVAFGTSIMIWSNSSINTFSLSQSLFLQQGSESLKERPIIEFVYFNGTSPKIVNVYVRNVGENNINVDAISILELSQASTASIFQTANLQVYTSADCKNIEDKAVNEANGIVGKGCWKNFAAQFNFNTGQVYKITATTSNGNTVITHATA